jgi:hypothetical protein
MAMNARSEIQAAEIEIRAAFTRSVGSAMNELLMAYRNRSPSDQDTFVAALIGHLVSLYAVSASAKTAAPSV